MMRKKIKFIISCCLFLLFSVNVKAYSLSCDYEIKSGDETLVIGTINIKYKKGDDAPIVNSKDNFGPLMSIYFIPFNDIPLSALQKSETDNTLSCPNLYVVETGSVSQTSYSIYYNASSLKGNYYISQPLNSSVVDNSDKPNNSDNNNSEVIQCTCKSIKNDYKHFSFNIVKNSDGIKYTNITQSGVSEYEKTFNFTFIGIEDCPEYVDVKSARLLDQRDFNITKGTSNSEYKCNNYSSYQDDNKYHLVYYKLSNGGTISSAINVYMDSGGNYVSTLGDNKDLKISNITTLNKNNPPSYIIKNGTTYSFATTIKDVKYEDAYILKSKLTELSQLPENDLKNTCEAIFGKTFINFLQDNVFKVIYIAVPIILLVLTTVDFAKVVFVDDKEGIKKAGSRFGKRLIAAILIYLTPTILIFIVDIIGADEVNSCMKMVRNYSQNN